MSESTSFLAPLMRAFVYYRKASGRWNEANRHKSGVARFTKAFSFIKSTNTFNHEVYPSKVPYADL